LHNVSHKRSEAGVGFATVNAKGPPWLIFSVVVDGAKEMDIDGKKEKQAPKAGKQLTKVNAST
jgi:hypothetical protein